MRARVTACSREALLGGKVNGFRTASVLLTLSQSLEDALVSFNYRTSMHREKEQHHASGRSLAAY